MAKKNNKALRVQYEERLRRLFLHFDGYDVLAFVFSAVGGPDALHYALMSQRVRYAIFDKIGPRAHVVVLPGIDQVRIREIAADLGGKEVKPKID